MKYFSLSLLLYQLKAFYLSMLRITLFSLLVNFLILHSTWAQLEFTPLFKDLGEMHELQDSVIVDFKMINKSEIEVRMTAVNTDCECIALIWSDEPVQPADTALLKVVFYPSKIRDSFFQLIEVNTSNAEKHVLTLKGQVFYTLEENEFGLKYIFESGDLKYRNKIINFGNVRNHQLSSREIHLYNQGNDTIRFTSIQSRSFLSIDFIDSVIAPKQMNTYKLSLDPLVFDDLGYLNERVFIQFESKGIESELSLTVMATVLPYFAAVSAEQLKSAPKIELVELVYDHGPTNEGVVFDKEFVIKNKGKTALEVFKVMPNCQCITTDWTKKTIAPDEEAILTVIFDTTGRRGTETKRVTLFNSDPQSSVMDLTIKTNVKVKK